ncbi:MAG: stage IV sporulation protein A [Bacillota bacterium]|nr:stage IV sporulation protein A [Bacillota bacterium]
MDKYNIYADIARRTQGDIYIGLAGPVRTGKSTFIKRFMESLVLPNIEDAAKKERAHDELPQSAAGRTIMTTEPKFIPNEAVEVKLDDNARFKVRLIDCVGYVVPAALGYIEGEGPRMVHTPWDEESMPFDRAAEIGTKKVITEHSTIGLVVTTDGSIGEIPRSAYVDAEARVIGELKAIDKPFITLLNTTKPNAPETEQLRDEMEEQYGVPVLPVNIMEMDENEIRNIMEKVLFEFPIKEINITLPKWVDVLENTHWLKAGIYGTILESAADAQKIREIGGIVDGIGKNENVKNTHLAGIDLGKGIGYIDVNVNDDLFYRVLGEKSGLEINDEESLITIITDLAAAKREYDKLKSALDDVREKGYGIVTPTIDELRLEEPEIVKQGGKFGVRLRASAPSIHMMMAEIQTEVSPIVGSEKQSEDLVKYILSEFEENPTKIWESNIFGKSLHELVNEGLHSKLSKMPDDARYKLRSTLERIINEGSGSLICIIL